MCTHCTQTKCYLHFFLINDIPVLLWVTGQRVEKRGGVGRQADHTHTADNRCFSCTPHPNMTGSTATSLTTDDFTVTDDSAARHSNYTRHKTLTWAWKLLVSSHPPCSLCNAHCHTSPCAQLFTTCTFLYWLTRGSWPVSCWLPFQSKVLKMLIEKDLKDWKMWNQMYIGMPSYNVVVNGIVKVTAEQSTLVTQQHEST